MVSTKKKRRPRPFVQKHLPSGQSATITTREFKRSSASHLVSVTSVSSSRSSTPLPTNTTHESSSDATETQLYSDVDEELLENVARKKRKGPSRSVSVSTLSFFSLFKLIWCSHNWQTLLEEWFQYQEEFMDEYIRLESSPLLTCLPQCVKCQTPQAVLRCIDCFGESLFCQECLLLLHCHEPFHHVQVIRSAQTFSTSTNCSQRWTGTYFERVLLKDLGAVFQLGHEYGISCPVPSSPIPLTLFDVTGIHTINVTYCECDPDGSGVPPRVQLLRIRWFPATWHRPGTAFTFRLLNLLHKLQSTCKVNLYDFHNAIAAVFDNSGLGKSLVSIFTATTRTAPLTSFAVQVQRTFSGIPHLCVSTPTPARRLYPCCWWALCYPGGRLSG